MLVRNRLPVGRHDASSQLKTTAARSSCTAFPNGLTGVVAAISGSRETRWKAFAETAWLSLSSLSARSGLGAITKLRCWATWRQRRGTGGRTSIRRTRPRRRRISRLRSGCKRAELPRAWPTRSRQSCAPMGCRQARARSSRHPRSRASARGSRPLAGSCY